jgi:hypothetical protein
MATKPASKPQSKKLKGAKKLEPTKPLMVRY